MYFPKITSRDGIDIFVGYIPNFILHYDCLDGDAKNPM